MGDVEMIELIIGLVAIGFILGIMISTFFYDGWSVRLYNKIFVRATPIKKEIIETQKEINQLKRQKADMAELERLKQRKEDLFEEAEIKYQESDTDLSTIEEYIHNELKDDSFYDSLDAEDKEEYIKDYRNALSGSGAAIRYRDEVIKRRTNK